MPAHLCPESEAYKIARDYLHDQEKTALIMLMVLKGNKMYSTYSPLFTSFNLDQDAPNVIHQNLGNFFARWVESRTKDSSLIERWEVPEGLSCGH